MDRNKIFNHFLGSDEFLIGKLADDIELALQIDYIVFSNIFYSPNIWNKLKSLENVLGIKIFTYGLNEFCEKKLVAIAPATSDFDYSTDNIDVVYFKIDGQTPFNTLLHKDFLGAIMNTGVKRDFFGDLVVKNNIAYGITTQSFYQILERELTSVGRYPIKISIVSSDSIPQTEFQEVIISVSSLRIDSVVAELGNFSRNESVDKISSNEILIDYTIPKGKSSEIKIQDVITIRKRGKFIFTENLGESRKGKKRLKFLKYI